MLLVVPVLMTVAPGCKSLEEIQDELKSSGVPVITSIVPNSAKVGGVVTLRGVNFEATAGRVGFQDANSNVSIAEITGWADDFVVTKVPALAGNPETAKVHLVTASGKVIQLTPTLTILP